jgi:signal transduction histidine kinase
MNLQTEILDLKGEWRFFPSKLQQQVIGAAAAESVLLSAPRSWNGIQLKDSVLQGIGYGTYRLQVLLPPNSGRLALKMNEQGTAVNVYANGHLVAGRGTVSANASLAAPQTMPLSANLDHVGETLILDIEISNFNYRKGGMWSVIQLGSEQNIAQKHSRVLSLEIFVAGTLIIIALYHFALFSYYRHERAGLIFAIFCTALFLRLITTGQRVLPEIFPAVGFEIYSRIEYISWFFSVPLGIHYVDSLFHNIGSRRIIILLYSMATLFSLTLFFPSRFYSYSVLPSNLVFLVFILYGVVRLLKLVGSNLPGLGLFIFGAVVLALFTINDVLYIQEVFRFTLLGPFGMLVFVFCQAVVLSRHFLAVFQEKELLQLKLSRTLQLQIEAKTQEAKAAYEVSKASRQQFDNVVNNIPGITYRSSAEPPWQMFFMSSEFERLSGFPLEAFIGPAARNFHELLSPEDAWERERHIAFADKRDSRYRVIYRLRGHDDRDIWIEDRGQKIFEPNGNLAWLDGVMIDITLRKQIESAKDAAVRFAESANSAKSEFLANMSHELRTPLHGVISMVSLLGNTNLDTEQREFLDLIEKSGSDLLALINQLLDLAKIESGNLELDVHSFNLEQLVTDTCAVLKVGADQKGLELTWDIASDMPVEIESDALKLKQILINLIGNAIKFTHAGAVQVKVTSHRDSKNEQNVTIAVTDSGVGMGASEMHRIFEPFLQADASISRKYGGTGLGLTITRQLVEMLKGQIAVDSQLGVGSKFTVTIPAKVGI